MAVHLGLERITLTSYVEAAESTAPTRVRPNTLRFYVKDNGSGESVFCFKDEDGDEFCTNATSGFVVPHTLLNASEHSDTASDAVSRGSLIYGNSTPKWDELTIGSTGTYLGSDGTDASWRAQSTLDHGSIGGLTDDDHAQYLLLVGRSGGQIVRGGTGSGDDLTLRSTSNATKGDIFLADEGGNIIIGGGATGSRLRIMEPSGSGTNYIEFLVPALAANVTYTLPNNDGDADDILVTDGSGGLSWTTVGAGGLVDAEDVTFTPAEVTDWDGGADPGDVQEALDQLAERLTDGGGSGGATFHPFLLLGA